MTHCERALRVPGPAPTRSSPLARPGSVTVGLDGPRCGLRKPQRQAEGCAGARDARGPHASARIARVVLALAVLTLAAQSPTPADAATPRCKGKKATIVGTAGADRIRGTKRADVIVGLGGNDRISGGRRRDIICGGPGNDTISGDGGFDTLAGNGDRDVLKGGNGLLEIDRLEAAAATTGFLGRVALTS